MSSYLPSPDDSIVKKRLTPKTILSIMSYAWIFNPVIRLINPGRMRNTSEKEGCVEPAVQAQPVSSDKHKIRKRTSFYLPILKTALCCVRRATSNNGSNSRECTNSSELMQRKGHGIPMCKRDIHGSRPDHEFIYQTNRTGGMKNPIHTLHRRIKNDDFAEVEAIIYSGC